MVYELTPLLDPVLTQKLDPFDFNNPPTDPIKLAYDITETMVKHNGHGIAANQLGLPYRVFCMASNPVFVCYNPRIVDASSDKAKILEGCLSFPGLTLNIERPIAIKARFTQPNGETVTHDFTGMTARIFQHELDHLDGILFTKHVSRLNLEMAKRKANKAMGRKFYSV